jgi:hypothetical protein
MPRPHLEETAFVPVEEAAEDGVSIEARQAEPVD